MEDLVYEGRQPEPTTSPAIGWEPAVVLRGRAAVEIAGHLLERGIRNTTKERFFLDSVMPPLLEYVAFAPANIVFLDFFFRRFSSIEIDDAHTESR